MITQKQIIRKKITSIRHSISRESVVGLSRMICDRLTQTDLFKQANCVALYCATGNEVQTTDLLEAWHLKRQFVLPVIAGETMYFYPYTGKENLKKNTFGIWEPVSGDQKTTMSDRMKSVYCDTIPPESIDLFVVPGIAFDYDGNRLGRGKGYYDRYLSSIDKPTIGICYDFQLVEHLPCESYDKKMTIVISETVIINVHNSLPL